MITFVNRKEELSFLRQIYSSESFEFIVIYGRRRIGKTELVKQFIKNKKSIYFLCKESTELENINSFKESAKNILDLEHVKNDWESVFKYLSEKLQEKFVIVLDEFPYLIKNSPGILSIFQRIIDLYLAKTKIKLILLGSSVSIIEKDILSYKSPLYGRRTGEIKLKPLKFEACIELLKKDVEEAIKIYGITGGVPLYLLKFKEKEKFWKLVERNVLTPGSFFREEANFLLSQEFREPSIYFSILEAIALGNSKLSEIINFCGFKDKSSISPYLNKLIFLGIVKKEKPILSKQKRKYRYSIGDEYFNFYFRYIYPNLSAIEEEIFDIETIKQDYNTYLGPIFEKICKETIIKMIKKRMISKFNKIGKQWGKIQGTKETYEIDLLALNHNTKYILFAECKWKDKVNAKTIAKELIEKSQYVQWYNKERKESFAIFAKSFSKKIEEFEGKKVYCFDLKDIKKVLKVKTKSKL